MESSSARLGVYPKVWGAEDWIVNRSFCGKILTINKGYQCSLHYHRNKDETFFVLSGTVLMEVEGEERLLKSGDKQDVFPGMQHRFAALEDSKIIEFSTHHEEEDSYRLELSRRIPDEELEALLEKFATA